MEDLVKKLKGANMDIDLATLKGMISWQQEGCPCNKNENTNEHKCAVKNVSLCQYFCGIEYTDTLLCSYPNPNPLKRK
jgi:hypothetical protein